MARDADNDIGDAQRRHAFVYDDFHASFSSVKIKKRVSGCRLPYFCPGRRFAAYREQGQTPAPHATSTFAAIFPIA